MNTKNTTIEPAKRCRACGKPVSPACDCENAAKSTLADRFGSLLDLPTVEPQAASGATTGESVWVSSKLNYFRDGRSRWPDEIGFIGFTFPLDGAYRRLDQFWLAWLNRRVHVLTGFQKSDGILRLREIVTESLNAGCVPESYDDPSNWPRIVPADYDPPQLFRFWF